jgi:hypothetical protein
LSAVRAPTGNNKGFFTTQYLTAVFEPRPLTGKARIRSGK